MISVLFRHIETLQQGLPWGDFLDAGTGVNSALWGREIPTRSWTGVSGSAGHLAQVQSSLAPVRPGEELVLGNWLDPDLLRGRRYDTVLADYLIGAIEGFAPYYQSQILRRLRLLVAGRLYIVGLDPYVVGSGATPSEQAVRSIGRLRDAVLLMANEIPYREYPLEWVLAELDRADFEVISARRFGNRYREKWVNGQLNMAARRLPALPAHLRASMSDEIERLRVHALDICLREGGLRCGFDYVVAARPA